MMRRFRTTATLYVALALGVGVVASSSAQPQPAKRAARIGVLLPRAAPDERGPDVLRDGLRDAGWVEGVNLVIERRYAGVNAERAQQLASELVQIGVDIIVAPATGVAHAAKTATQSVPIVMLATDPIATGLVTSLARPAGNVTGLTNIAPEVTGKQIELLRETVPRLGRVAALVNPANPSTSQVVAEAEAGTQRLGMRLRVVEVRTPGDLDPAFAELARERSEALLVQGDPLLMSERARIVDLATRRRLPQIYVLRSHVEAGGLMAYGASYSDLLRRAALYVDKILRGARPGDLPIEQPTKFELVVNLKAAGTLGVTIPQSVLIRADEIIR
jgi:putative ABC transport system substrate-binding protein